MTKNLSAAASKLNIRRAYLEVARQFEIGGHVSRYAGLDGTKLSDVDYSSARALEEVRAALLAAAPLMPPRLVKIKKRGGGERNVYILSVADRIRARALFRILEPLCERAYSPYLFSYRSGKTSHFASRSIARRYHKYFGKDHILTVDLKSYSDHLDHGILRQKLFEIGADDELLRMLEPFFEITVWQGSHRGRMSAGLPQGTPLTSLFANLYLSEVDHAIGPRVALYRRVGDDIIVCDTDEKKRDEALALIRERIKNLRLTIQANKTHAAVSSQPFDFLGYHFHDNMLSLPASFVTDLEIGWRRTLRACSGSVEHRLRRLKNIVWYAETSLHNQLLELLRQHPHADDDAQMKFLSERLYTYATTALLGKAMPRQRRLAQPLLTSIGFPSLYDYYLAYRRGRESLAPQAAPGATRPATGNKKFRF